MLAWAVEKKSVGNCLVRNSAVAFGTRQEARKFRNKQADDSDLRVVRVRVEMIRNAPRA